MSAVERLIAAIERLVTIYGPEHRQQIEGAVADAWAALRSIEDLGDRLVTAERLARIELSARIHAEGPVRRSSLAGVIPAVSIPAPRFPNPDCSDSARLAEPRNT